MITKPKLSKPTVLLLYGLPGSGKSFFSRQTSEALSIPHISSDRIRYELFEKPTMSKEELSVVQNIMLMMLEEFLKLGISAIFDISINRLQDRRNLRDMIRKSGGQSVLIWLQSDPDTCFNRAKSRDKRKADDKYSHEITPEQFENVEKSMQNPQNEDAIVLSGKHLYDSQKQSLLRRLREMQLLDDTELTRSVAKPELVNLVSHAQMTAGRVDPNRRNVIIS